MATFDITLDATQLSYTGFVIAGALPINYFPNNGGTWTTNTQAYTVALEPASYTFQVASGSLDTFSFTVTADGTITLSEGAASYATVEGTKLVIHGFEVKVDARYITGQLLWDSNQYARPPIVFETYRMIPMSGYGFAMQDICSFRVTLDTNGLWQYDPSFEYKTLGLLKDEATGFLQGQGTSTLALLGYPLLIDARNGGGTGVALNPSDISGGFATTGVMFANILPSGGQFTLNFGYGPNTRAASFTMDLAGNITPAAELPYRFSFDKFHGITRLTADKVVSFATEPVLETEHVTPVPANAELVSK